jgi:allantoicase
MSDVGVISHLRLTILPDGGIMRIRAYGLKEQYNSRL